MRLGFATLVKRCNAQHRATRRFGEGQVDWMQESDAMHMHKVPRWTGEGAMRIGYCGGERPVELRAEKCF